MKELWRNIVNFSKTVMNTLHSLWQLKIFRLFLIILVGLLFSTIVLAIKSKGATADQFGFAGIDFNTIGLDDFMKFFFGNGRTALDAHRDATEIIRRFYEQTGNVPYGYSL